MPVHRGGRGWGVGTIKAVDGDKLTIFTESQGTVVRIINTVRIKADPTAAPE